MRLERDALLGEAPPAQAHNEERLLYYDASWRLLEEHITTSYLDLNDPMGLSHFDKAMATQYVWGNRHIDDAIMKRMDTDNDGTWDETFFYATDVPSLDDLSAVACNDPFHAIVYQEQVVMFQFSAECMEAICDR